MKSLSLSKPHLLVMIGIPGSGKSFFAEKFSETFSAPYLNSGVLEEISHGDRTISSLVAAYVLKELFKTNQTILVDHLGDTRSGRVEIKKLAKEAGYNTKFIWVQTDAATAKSRSLRASKSTGKIMNSNDYDELAAKFKAPTQTESDIVVISGKHTYATQARVVLKQLASKRESGQSVKLVERKVIYPGRRIDIT